MKKVENWTDKILMEASEYIYNNGITDEDTKQDLYVLALECAKLKNEGKCRFTFAKYVERNYKQCTEDVEIQSIDNNMPYTMDFDDSVNTEYLLYLISTLTPIEQNVLYYRYIDAATLEQTGKLIGKSAERARVIASKAVRKLSNPSKLKYIIDLNGSGSINSAEFESKFEQMIKNSYKPICEFGINDGKKAKQPEEKVVIITTKEDEELKEKQKQELMIESMRSELNRHVYSTEIKLYAMEAFYLVLAGENYWDVINTSLSIIMANNIARIINKVTNGCIPVFNYYNMFENYCISFENYDYHYFKFTRDDNTLTMDKKPDDVQLQVLKYLFRRENISIVFE